MAKTAIFNQKSLKSLIFISPLPLVLGTSLTPHFNGSIHICIVFRIIYIFKLSRSD